MIKKGSKLARTETVTIRLDPKIKYLGEIAARKQRRTLSSFIEWAIEMGIESEMKIDFDLWDVDESDRFAKLAWLFPIFLTFDEQKRWKKVMENKAFWKKITIDEHGFETWKCNIENFDFKKFREENEATC